MFTYHAHVQLVTHAETTPFLNEEHKHQVESMYAHRNQWMERKQKEKRREEKKRKRRKGTQEQEQRLEFNGGCALNIECNKEGRQNQKKKNREQPKNRRRTSLQLHVVAATERGREKRESAREREKRESARARERRRASDEREAGTSVSDCQ